MIYKLQIRFFSDASNPDSAKKVFDKISKSTSQDIQLDNIETYHKGGHVLHAYIEVDKDIWSEAVYESLCLLQCFGRSWQLTGNVELSFDAVSNDPNVPGLSFISSVMLQE